MLPWTSARTHPSVVCSLTAPLTATATSCIPLVVTRVSGRWMRARVPLVLLALGDTFK